MLFVNEEDRVATGAAWEASAAAVATQTSPRNDKNLFYIVAM